jgi:hypothetical protein
VPALSRQREFSDERAYLWLPAIAAFGFLGTASLAPAMARGSAGGVVAAGHRSIFVGRGQVSMPRFRAGSPRIIANGAFNGRNGIGNRNDFGRQRADLGSIVAWPYLWSLDPTPESFALTGDPAPSTPPVIVVSGSPANALQQTAQAAPPDFSYVAGCHAIPGGYHCDTPHRPATPPRPFGG